MILWVISMSACWNPCLQRAGVSITVTGKPLKSVPAVGDFILEYTLLKRKGCTRTCEKFADTSRAFRVPMNAARIEGSPGGLSGFKQGFPPDAL